jgi:competence protein ComEC
MRRPLLGIALIFSLGILIESAVNIPIFYIFLCASTALVLSIAFIKSKRRFLLFAVFAFLFLGALAYKSSILLPKDHIKNIMGPDGGFPRQVLVQGQICNKPHNRQTYFTQEKSEFLLNVKCIKVGNNWHEAKGLLLTQVLNQQIDFQYGDEVVLEGDLTLPRPATNPGQLDYRSFLEKKKIFYLLNVEKGDFSKIIGQGKSNLIKQIAYKISDRIELLIDKFMPPLEGSVLDAILLGNRRDISGDMRDKFIHTGTIHILSISGLHVGLLASIFIILFKLFRVPFRFSVVALAALLVLYCSMVDNRPPVTRATIMVLVFLFGRLFKREQDLLNSLAFSAFVILFFNSRDLFNIGFQLSFLTMGSIIYFLPRLEEALQGDSKKRAYFLRAFLISFSAWLGSAPLVAKYFNIISPVTLIANIFIVPWMFLVLATAVTFVIFGFISSALGLIFSEVCAFSTGILLKAVAAFSKIPFSYFRVKSPSWISVIAFYAFIFLFFNRRLIRIRAKHFLIMGLVIFNAFIWRGIFFEKQDFLKISFLDVGKGDSIFFEFPKGGTMLVDAGEGLMTDMGRLVVGSFLEHKGINKIDVVMLTHPHADHVGGLSSILKNFKVRFFVDNGDMDRGLLCKECQTLIRQKGIKRYVLKRGDRITGFEDVALLILNPPIKGFNSFNNNSIVLKLEYQDFSALFCGDIEEEAAADLLLFREKELQSTVLKVPHHGGSLGGAAWGFLGNVNPEAAVVSRNEQRSIDSDILGAFKKIGSMIYSTDKDGAIFLEKTKHDKYKIATFKKSFKK